MGLNYFFDTYAMFEMIHGNRNYLPYKNALAITTKLNLMELHYRILMLYGREYAEKAYNKFLEITIELTDDIIKQANEFKLKNRKKKLSYVDCVGYVLARINRAKFLTGDKEFEKIDDVEFVK